jgi:hypothetical protein
LGFEVLVAALGRTWTTGFSAPDARYKDRRLITYVREFALRGWLRKKLGDEVVEGEVVWFVTIRSLSTVTAWPPGT